MDDELNEVSHWRSRLAGSLTLCGKMIMQLKMTSYLQYTVDSTLMKYDAGSWIQMQGHGGGGRFEDKLKEVCYRWSKQAVWLT